MITLLRKIRKSLIESGSARKYLLYAVGEIALVVIGILIALQINNWNNSQFNQKEEIEILSAFKSTLQDDLEDLKNVIKNVESAVNRTKILQEIISLKQTENVPDSLFGGPMGMHYFEMNTATFEALKSRSFNLISNKSIRTEIIKIYDTHYKRTESIKQLDSGTTLTLFRPYYLENFSDIRIWESALPNDESKVLSDPYFENLLDYRLTVFSLNQLLVYPIVINDMENLLAMIDDFLGL